MKYLEKDSDVYIFNSHEELEEYLQFRKENDEWVVAPINESAVIGIEEFPLMQDQICQEHGVDANNPNNVECIADNGLFLSFIKDGERVIFPTRLIAFPSICMRAGLAGQTISNFDMQKNKLVLPIIEKAAWLSRGMSLYKANSKILVRDEKVSAMLSSEYAILPADELIDALEKEIAEEHPKFSFLGGNVSHEYLHVEYLLNNDNNDDRFQILLREIQYGEFEKVKCGIGFATSDVGLSSAYAYPFFWIKNMAIRFGEAIAIKHEGKNSVAKFQKEIVRLAALFKEAEDQIEKMGNTDLKSVAETVANIVADHKNVFPKAQADEVIKELRSEPDSSGTAIDAYLALNDIVDRYCKTKGSNPSVQLNMMDKVTKFVYTNYEKYDI